MKTFLFLVMKTFLLMKVLKVIGDQQDLDWLRRNNQRKIQI
jgi:hypothetical protein